MPLASKDIPVKPILEHLKYFSSPHKPCGRWGGRQCSEGHWCFRYMEDEPDCILNAFPRGVHEKVVLSKMRKLIKQGLADGCPCGCRGDFEITDKGREWLNAETV